MERHRALGYFFGKGEGEKNLLGNPLMHETWNIFKAEPVIVARIANQGAALAAKCLQPG